MTESIDTPNPYFQLRSGRAAKLGQHAEGHVHYELLTDCQNQVLSIRLTSNDGGGYFSRESVPFARVRAAVADVEENQAFPSKRFRESFIGRSSNNAGFLACVLRTEGLITAAPDHAHLHQLSGNWLKWEQACLELLGEPISSEGQTESLTAPAKISKKEARAHRKSDRGHAVPEAGSHEEERVDAHPA